MTTINGKVCVANGRNLYIDTNNFDNPDVWTNWGKWHKTGEKFNGLTVMETNSSWGGLGQPIRVVKGEVYTFSVYARYESGTGSSIIYTVPDGSTAKLSQTSFKFSLNETWQRISATFTVLADGVIDTSLARTDNNTNTLLIAGPKIERGSKATDYSPVPVDKVFSNGKQVYGRNLLIGSTDNIVHYTSVSGFTVWKSYVTKFNVGDTLNVSADITSNSGKTVLKAFLLSSTGIQLGYLNYDVLVGQTAHAFVSKAIPTGTASILVQIDNSNLNGPGKPDVCAISHQFANTGSVVANWTPAPEDVLKGDITAPNNLVGSQSYIK